MNIYKIIVFLCTSSFVTSELAANTGSSYQFFDCTETIHFQKDDMMRERFNKKEYQDLFRQMLTISDVSNSSAAIIDKLGDNIADDVFYKTRHLYRISELQNLSIKLSHQYSEFKKILYKKWTYRSKLLKGVNYARNNFNKMRESLNNKIKDINIKKQKKSTFGRFLDAVQSKCGLKNQATIRQERLIQGYERQIQALSEREKEVVTSLKEKILSLEKTLLAQKKDWHLLAHNANTLEKLIQLIHPYIFDHDSKENKGKSSPLKYAKSLNNKGKLAPLIMQDDTGLLTKFIMEYFDLKDFLIPVTLFDV